MVQLTLNFNETISGHIYINLYTVYKLCSFIFSLKAMANTILGGGWNRQHTAYNVMCLQLILKANACPIEITCFPSNNENIMYILRSIYVPPSLDNACLRLGSVEMPLQCLTAPKNLVRLCAEDMDLDAPFSFHSHTHQLHSSAHMVTQWILILTHRPTYDGLTRKTWMSAQRTASACAKGLSK